MAQFTIDEVITKGDGNPVIVDFQNGYPTEALRPEPCTVLVDPETNMKTYALELDDMLYTGKEVTDRHVETVIVKRNKITGKVTIIATGYAEMRPELNNDIESHFTETNNLELSRKFGSKKQKQQMEQKEKLKVNVEVVTEQMLKVTDEIKEEQINLAAYTNNDSEDFYIPPINRKADRAEDVYDISKILTNDEFETISSQLEGKEYSDDIIPWLQGLIAKKNLSPKHNVLVVYANCLLKLYNTNAREISKKSFTACSYSSALNEIILKHFTSQNNGKLLRPGPYRDKSLCYAVVLILLVNGLRFDLEGLCQAMKLTANNASMKIRTTSATVVNSGGKKIVQLKLPLNNKSGFRRKSAKF